MRKTSHEEGNVDYTGRAFHQDAMEAMRGDIVRGLIELITNSDDAYASLGKDRPGKIVVEVEHRKGQPWLVVVRDRASGMTGEVMKARLRQLGGRTSGFEIGESRRGNLGRGAKDLAAFGDVTFESIVGTEYALPVKPKRNLCSGPGGGYRKAPRGTRYSPWKRHGRHGLCSSRNSMPAASEPGSQVGNALSTSGHS